MIKFLRWLQAKKIQAQFPKNWPIAHCEVCYRISHPYTRCEKHIERKK